MSESEERVSKWTASMRRIGGSSLALIRNRLEFFGIELQEEKLRLLTLLVWLGVGMALGAAGLLVVVAALSIWMWEFAGYAGLCGLGAVLLGMAAAVLLGIRRRIRLMPPPFSGTVAEFRKDGECLRKK